MFFTTQNMLSIVWKSFVHQVSLRKTGVYIYFCQKKIILAFLLYSADTRLVILFDLACVGGGGGSGIIVPEISG